MEKEKKLNSLLRNARALHDSQKVIYNDRSENIWRFSNYNFFARKLNQLVQKTIEIDKSVLDLVDFFDLEKMPDSMDSTFVRQKELFDMVMANTSLLISFLEDKVDYKTSKTEILKDFIEANLRKAVLSKPSSEIDIQDNLEQIFIGKGYSKGIDYDREKGRTKVSIKETIPDFIFPKFDLALEVKLCISKNKSKTIVDEINADIMSYSKSYSNLLFVIYDMGYIIDKDEFKNDLDNNNDILVSIIKN